jgi:hypothetical protein
MFADFRVHGLKKKGEAPSFCFPVSRWRSVVKAFENARVQPMYAKVREHGAPIQGARLGWKSGKLDEMTAARGMGCGCAGYKMSYLIRRKDIEAWRSIRPIMATIILTRTTMLWMGLPRAATSFVS